MKAFPTLSLSILLACATVANAQQQPQSHATSASPAPNPTDSAHNAGNALQRNGGSLLKATLNTASDPGQASLDKVSFFSVPAPEPRTLKKHDLVTIVVREQSQFSSEGTTDLKKDAALDAKLEQFATFYPPSFSLNNNIGTPAPEFKMSGSRNFKGEGTVDREDSLTMRVQAEVVDVKPNGTLVLQAKKKIKTDDETQEIMLTGLCRAEDVLADNTVLSHQLYDLDISKTHTGAVRDTTKRGWVPKLLDLLNPF